MRSYETIFILSPEINDELKQSLIQKFKGIITENGGEVTNVDEWGKRKLAYEIKKKNEGYYVLMNFNADIDVPHELERNYKITDGILRYLIVNLDK